MFGSMSLFGRFVLMACCVVQDSLPSGGITNMYNNTSSKVRLTFKTYEQSLWIGSAERTQSLLFVLLFFCFVRVRLGGAFYAVDFSLFYSKLAKLPWHVFFPLRDPFDSVMPTVQATSSSSCALYHSVGIAERVSKYMTSLRSPWLRGQTINDSMRETDISRPVALPAAGRVLVTGKRNRFQVSLDCAGEQLLYKRGYRNFISRSPLRESFTAAVLEAVDHDLNGTLNDYAVVDPFCGSG